MQDPDVIPPTEDIDEKLPEGTVDEGHPPIRYAIVPVGMFSPSDAIEVDGEKYDFDDRDVADSKLAELEDSHEYTIIEWRGQTQVPEGNINTNDSLSFPAEAPETLTPPEPAQ